MTEKEKLKEIIETVLGFHDYYKVVVTEKDIDRLVDKLNENGIRDITEKGVVAVEGEISIVPENFVADIKFALDGNVDELKRRAEVAERNDKIKERALTMACLDKASTYYPNRDERFIAVILRDEYLRQAEREIEREVKEKC